MHTNIRKDNSTTQRSSPVGNPNAGALTKRSSATKAEAHAFANQPTASDAAGLGNSPAAIMASPTVAEAVNRFYDHMACSGAKASTLSAIKAVFIRFMQQFGTRSLVSISSEEIERFLETPVNDRRGLRPPSPSYTLQMLKVVKAVFRREGQIDPFPGLQIKLPRNSSMVPVFNVDQAETMLQVARPNERGMVAMVFFGAFRPLELEQMSAEMVNIEARTILVPAKLGPNRRTVILSELGSDGELPCLPPAIFDWLKENPFEAKRWLPIKSRLADAVGSWIPNGCRQTAIANCAAAYGTHAALTLMTRSPYYCRSGLRYVGRVSHGDAKRFYSLTPIAKP